MEFVLGIATLLAIALCGTILFAVRRRHKRSEPTVNIIIERMKAVGELTAYKILAKEIISQTDHAFGTFGQDYFSWFLTKRKMILIFDLQIEFRYDLRAPEFSIEKGLLPGRYHIQLPPCRHEVLLRNIQLYDAQGGALMPWLLPGLIANIPGGFSIEDTNQTIATAREKAEQLAKEQISKLETEIQKSAITTLTSLARAFGASDVSVEFKASAQPLMVVELAPRVAA